MATLKFIKIKEAHQCDIKECFYLKHDISYCKMDFVTETEMYPPLVHKGDNSLGIL